MKFSCEKCGRSYVADEKVRHRAFRMKCKQCGNVIVVKPASLPTPAPGSIPSITQLNLTPVELESGSDADPFAAMAAELNQELARVPEGPMLAPPDPFQEEPSRPPPPTLYPGVPPLPPEPRFAESRPPAGPPAPKLSESEEAFADLSRQMGGETGERPLHVQGGDVVRAPSQPAAPRTPSTAPEVARPPRRWLAALVGLGAGGGVAALIVYLLANSGPVVKLASPAAEQAAPAPAQAAPAPAQAAPAPAQAAPAPPPAPAPAAAAPAPAASAPPPAVPAPAPAPAAAAPEPAARERPRREVRREPEPARPARPQAAAAAPPAPPPPAVAVAAPPATAPVSSPPAAPRSEAAVRPSQPAPPPVSSSTDQPLDERQIEATIARSQSGFEACVAQARTDEPQLVGESRRITMTMTVNPNGRVLYPTLDDALLTSTALGSCLKREAAKMAFPEFGGDPVRVRVPLVLR